VSKDIWDTFIQRYPSAINAKAILNANCVFEIANCKLLDFTSSLDYDVIYFDAFAAIHQPEMWTTEALEQVTQHLKPGGVFVTYAITGNLKRSLKSLGFSIEKAPGAPGKREMLRGVKKG
jgi:tRNA U34 5-methylaminomethyl-2-thiouridine-forming methyltransferase MnmC